MNNETVLLKTVLFGKKTVADPGFPRGEHQSQRGCVSTHYSAKFLPKTTRKWKKLHWELMLMLWGCPPPPTGSATAFVPLTTSDVICERFRAAHPQLVESPEYLWNICIDKYIYMYGIKIVTIWHLDHGQQTLSFFYVVYNYVINLITQTYEHIKMNGGR